ncbi:hypothetical protein BD310DRAFT_939800 [Dichomitus squalens]|uniref:Uncharacterized protein n=1 Tax=Dichomitus squalens TaxID=114155 RepID=A0A4Q9PHW7_9APHY|nr:hypothetical protein BD310DRAFT_939800 [Dichomitus squalens]
MHGMEYPFQSHLAIYETVTKLDRLDVLSLYYIGNTCLKAISQLQEGTPELESPTAWLICCASEHVPINDAPLRPLPRPPLRLHIHSRLEAFPHKARFVTLGQWRRHPDERLWGTPRS